MSEPTKSASNTTACPQIVPKDELCLDVNEPTEYRCDDGSIYTFYVHTTPDGRLENVQFCKRCGRKKDVFGCLNENEWKACVYLPHEMLEAPANTALPDNDVSEQREGPR